MFFALSIFFTAIFLLDLKVIIRTVIIKDLVVSAAKEMTVFVNIRLDHITFISENIQCTVNIVQLIGWTFQKLRSGLERRTFTGRFQDPCVDQIGKDGIDIKLKFILSFQFSTDLIHLELIVKGLKKNIATTIKYLFIISDLSVGTKRDQNCLGFFFAFVFFGFQSNFVFCPCNDIIPGWSMFRK